MWARPRGATVAAFGGVEMYSRSRGFTLVELMVIVVLLGVMVAFAIPSFVNLIKGNSMASARNDLQKSLDY
ncbi:prepilin-type N-terminal cleavage/methylation domain-containing protein, partial [Pseudomonas aeruginosa]|uniref:pilus assembly FimT family protein n=1 Tax=Pseudomonas aeruginosa TaxID=287 RepID=UPI002713F858